MGQLFEHPLDRNSEASDAAPPVIIFVIEDQQQFLKGVARLCLNDTPCVPFVDPEEGQGRFTGPLTFDLSSSLQVQAGKHMDGWHEHASVFTLGDLSLMDTITRISGATLNDIGDTATVSFQFFSLSLENTTRSPLQVVYGRVDPSFYNLFIDLNPDVT